MAGSEREGDRKQAAPEKILFITGKLAEPALRRTLDELAPSANFQPIIAPLPITVAALMTADWIARHLPEPFPIVDKIILPGLCRGEPEVVAQAAQTPVVRGPKDLRDLPEFFGKRSGPPADYGPHSIEIIAEINHAPTLTPEQLLNKAEHYRRSGADLIDLGCDPGSTWDGIANAVSLLKSHGFAVSVDSFNPVEVESALAAGAELVLSVNSGNKHHALRWAELSDRFELVVIPDTPAELETLFETAEFLSSHGIKTRLDPILEPIGFGFYRSLERYAHVRQRLPDSRMMMGVGNLTELSDVDSAGINLLLAAICQELNIQSVLTTEVINWCRSAVKEFDVARRLVHYSLTHGIPPKKVDTSLVTLRDPKPFHHGEERLKELAQSVTDRNYRIMAEEDSIHLFNGMMHLNGLDPFIMFAEVCQRDAKMDNSHSFYLGFEMAKALIALQLGKNYDQDRPLRWGILDDFTM